MVPDFAWPDTERLYGKRFRLFGKRGRCAISLLLEIMPDARFHLAGKRSHWPGNDFNYYLASVDVAWVL